MPTAARRSRTASRRDRVVSEQVAYQMVSMLEDVVERGTGASARSLGVTFPAAGKTGTTDQLQGRLVRRLLLDAGSRRLGGLRSAGADRPQRLRRARRPADLGGFHDPRRPRPPPRPIRSPRRAAPGELCRVSYLQPMQDVSALHRVLQERRQHSHPPLPDPHRSAQAARRASGRGPLLLDRKA